MSYRQDVHRWSCAACSPPKVGIKTPTACLVAVAMLWATYGVAMRMIYADPGIVVERNCVDGELFPSLCAMDKYMFCRCRVSASLNSVEVYHHSDFAAPRSSMVAHAQRRWIQCR